MTGNWLKMKKWLFSRSHQKSTKSHPRVLQTSIHHILDETNSKKLSRGTSGQTGNSCFFDFWGEYLVNFGGKSNFFPWPKVVHYQCSTNSLITIDPQKPLLPPHLVPCATSGSKTPHFRRSKVAWNCQKRFARSLSPTLHQSIMCLWSIVYELQLLPPWTLIFWEEKPFFLDLGNFYCLARLGHQDFYFRIPSLCPHAKN